MKNNKNKHIEEQKQIENENLLLKNEIENAELDNDESKQQNIKAPRIIEKKEKQERHNKKQTVDISKIKRFSVNTKIGLSQAQVESRVCQGLTNKTDDKNTKSYTSIFLSNIFTFFNILCFAVAIALISVNAWSNTLYMVIVIANMLIGIIQEIRAKITIEKISLVTSPTALVVRDKEQITINIKDVVLDDIIIYTTGKQICADCEILDGEVEVNESLLTGESVPLKKGKGKTLLSGSFIVSGKCYARVTSVGNQNYSAKLAGKAKQYQKPKSELLGSMRLIITIIGIIILPLSIFMFLNNYNNAINGIPQAIQQTAGSVIGMIPAGMFLLTSVALAVGVVKLARKRTLVQDLYSIEMLARADILCLDKTGTITDGTMKVNTVIQVDQTIKCTIDSIMGSLLTALDDNNQTSRALISHFGYSKEFTPKYILPFSSTRKLSGVTFKNGETYLMGAPEFVIKGQKDKNVDNMIKQYAEKGFRVIALAKGNSELADGKLPLVRTCIAIIVIEDHIREDASQTIKWFRDNGVQIKIISGDNPITVSEVSRRVGVENAEKFISLEGLNEQQVIDAVDNYTVFGRVSPEQKCILVKALKSKGHKVAMTGDGVNDILALKEADCSIAMASGSEATRNVSHLVLLDSNFSSMPSVVSEGRRVVNNVQNSSSLFLMKTIFTIITSILCLIFAEPYPFTTLHIILLETLVIGIPSFFLALQPNNDAIKGKFLSNLLAKSLPGALVFVLNIVTYYVLSITLPGVAFQWEMMASISITFTGLVVLFRLCSPLNAYRGVLVLSMFICTFAALTILPLDFFFGEGAEPLTLQNILFVLVVIQASYPIYSTIVKSCDKIIYKQPR